MTGSCIFSKNSWRYMNIYDFFMHFLLKPCQYWSETLKTLSHSRNSRKCTYFMMSFQKFLTLSFILYSNLWSETLKTPSDSRNRKKLHIPSRFFGIFWLFLVFHTQDLVLFQLFPLWQGFSRVLNLLCLPEGVPQSWIFIMASLLAFIFSSCWDFVASNLALIKAFCWASQVLKGTQVGLEEFFLLGIIA